MSRLTLEEILIANLNEKLHQGTMPYMTKESAYQALKKWTGQDFGYDSTKWEEWINENGLPLLDTTVEEKKNSVHK